MNRRIGATNVSYTNHNNHTEVEKQRQRRHKEDREIGGKGLRKAVKESKVKEGWEESLPYLRKTAMSKHIETRNKIKDIPRVSSFTELIDSAMLTEEDKIMLKLHYIDGHDFRYIGDTLGYSESTMKRRHKKALAKIGRIL